ncbi:S9 family peptidase [Aliiglaciecola sp. 2_MG-2023]|uniref:S9 family peptidase n=1 Tax=unclassified Aliiglaciecola TaxID=2593648 RepID=UPI0026E1FE8B|nr:MULTISPECIES: S9 family peptidase [unclassified Aliiglaciecola]MDO6713294.1 S9 family peptidase [Aliiglaciecola sp. 2_MG-2023]MDO6754441.1 S9 family peptidase [Aliiglaciecola sp. 1_MG-2023]
MRLALSLLVPVLILSACSNDKEPEMQTYPRLKQLSVAAPVAAKQDYTAKYHGKELNDPYHWLRDSGYPEVNDKPIIDYLTAENAYFDQFLAPNKSLIDTVFEEVKGRTNEQEESVPWIDNGYEYRWYYREGEEYRTRSRKNLTTGEEEVFLDETKLAKDFDYFTLGGWDISPDNRLLVYSFNTDGAERYTVRIVDLQSGEYLEDEITEVNGEIAFGADSKTVIYGQLEKDKWRTASINVHKIGSQQSDDKIILSEADDGFFLSFHFTSDDKYLVVSSGQREVSELSVIPGDDLFSEPKLLISREMRFSASIDHANGKFYILANDTHKNSRFVSVDDSQPSYDNWQTLIEGSDDLYLLGMQTFKGFIALQAREKGIDKIRIRDYQGNSHDIAFPEPVYSASLGNSSEFDQDFVRVDYESMVTPDTVFDYQVNDKKLETRKVTTIPSGYDKSQYVTERLMAPSRDGVEVPISVVYKKGFKKNGKQPMHLYGYGAYGITVPPGFSELRLSLLDRGFAFAIAHVRGSDMLGYQWYLDGKLEKRTNAFNDFVDAAQYLIKENYVSEGNISISGRSAGGELMGAVTIQAPQLWRSVTLGVPFVDVLNTMLDATLPLTPPEWTEWGNPLEDSAAYDLIASYSPYDNIEAKEYPPMLVSGGINDPRVTYWEPAKWTAKMREMKTDDNLLIMRINMGAGHFANSGRYGRLRDYAEELVFMLKSHGIDK